MPNSVVKTSFCSIEPRASFSSKEPRVQCDQGLFQPLKRQRGMRFRPRVGKLDVEKISKVNVQEIQSETDITALQPLLPNLVFSDITTENERNDPAFLKLFQISQLTAEYLLLKQSKLTNKAEEMEKTCFQLKSSCFESESRQKEQEAEIERLQREIQEKRAKVETVESQLLAMEQKKVPVRRLKSCICPVCQQAFVSEEFLRQHKLQAHKEDEIPTTPCPIPLSNTVPVYIISPTGRVHEFQKTRQSTVETLYNDPMIELIHQGRVIEKEETIQQLMDRSIGQEQTSLTIHSRNVVAPAVEKQQEDERAECREEFETLTLKFETQMQQMQETMLKQLEIQAEKMRKSLIVVAEKEKEKGRETVVVVEELPKKVSSQVKGDIESDHSEHEEEPPDVHQVANQYKKLLEKQQTEHERKLKRMKRRLKKYRAKQPPFKLSDAPTLMQLTQFEAAKYGSDFGFEHLDKKKFDAACTIQAIVRGFIIRKKLFTAPVHSELTLVEKVELHVPVRQETPVSTAAVEEEEDRTVLKLVESSAIQESRTEEPVDELESIISDSELIDLDGSQAQEVSEAEEEEISLLESSAIEESRTEEDQEPTAVQEILSEAEEEEISLLESSAFEESRTEEAQEPTAVQEILSEAEEEEISLLESSAIEESRTEEAQEPTAVQEILSEAEEESQLEEKLVESSVIAVEELLSEDEEGGAKELTEDESSVIEESQEVSEDEEESENRAEESQTAVEEVLSEAEEEEDRTIPKLILEPSESRAEESTADLEEVESIEASEDIPEMFSESESDLEESLFEESQLESDTESKSHLESTRPAAAEIERAQEIVSERLDAELVEYIDPQTTRLSDEEFETEMEKLTKVQEQLPVEIREKMEIVLKKVERIAIEDEEEEKRQHIQLEKDHDATLRHTLHELISDLSSEDDDEILVQHVVKYEK